MPCLRCSVEIASHTDGCTAAAAAQAAQRSMSGLAQPPTSAQLSMWDTPAPPTYEGNLLSEQRYDGVGRTTHVEVEYFKSQDGEWRVRPNKERRLVRALRSDPSNRPPRARALLAIRRRAAVRLGARVAVDRLCALASLTDFHAPTRTGVWHVSPSFAPTTYVNGAGEPAFYAGRTQWGLPLRQVKITLNGGAVRGEIADSRECCCDCRSVTVSLSVVRLCRE